MRKWLIVCAVVSLIATSGAVLAGEGRGKADSERRGRWMKRMPHGPVAFRWFLHNEDAVKSLGVTEEQLGQLRDMTYQGEIQQIKGRADLEIAHMELRRLLHDAKPTEEAVGKAIDKISDLEAQLEKERVKQIFKAREILGEETFENIRDAMKAQMRERGMDRERGQRGDCRGMGLQNDDDERGHAAPAGPSEEEDETD